MEENWLPIDRYSEYEVSDLGRVRSLDREVYDSEGVRRFLRGKILAPQKERGGYLKVGLCSGGAVGKFKVHRLVAAHFLPPSSSQVEVNHIDFDRENNAAKNLEWMTRAENLAHSRAAGKYSAATNPNRAIKLTVESVKAIRTARNNGMTFAAIGVKFGICRQTATEVVTGKIWATA